MSLKTYIIDPVNNLKAEVNDDFGKEDRSLVVATRPLKEFINRIEFFFNPTFGIDMNVTPTVGGTDINIHDGLDNIYWTATGIVGPARWDFNSLAQSHTGTHSIDATGTVNGDEAEFVKGSEQDLTGYSSLSGWIYITSWSTFGTKNIHIHGWDTTSSMQVGGIVFIGDYIEKTTFNVWQKFVIPLGDLDLVGETIDAIRVSTLSSGGGLPPDYYLDDLKIEEEGAPLHYSIEPPFDTWLWIDQITITMVAALDTTLLNSSMHNLSYDKFLTLASLPVGLLFQRFHEGDITLTVNFHHILDVLQLPNTNILNVGSDGVTTWFTLNQVFASPIVLKAEEGDRLVFSVRDDMTGLIRFRIASSSRQEDRRQRVVVGI